MSDVVILHVISHSISVLLVDISS